MYLSGCEIIDKCRAGTFAGNVKKKLLGVGDPVEMVDLRFGLSDLS
jgi:hypothetical protein